MEYFLGCHNSRKGRTDIALKTADSGYITRKLCDSNQEVIVKEEDCKTPEYVQFNKYELQTGGESFADVVYGRVLAQDLQDDSGLTIAYTGDLIDRNLVNIIMDSQIETVQVRSSM